ncbi:hypothetical protein VVD49_05175 [Uliginosibacterium sp. H3]|uniref:Uncharacterized protein n=1 Tax=Uliginosibacterium silvisoli TaxID=3114758 RepID=A0ABU6JZK3_9RHOO|nr:hypothetical protein [Uliginosibacterium sp. H3]
MHKLLLALTASLVLWTQPASAGPYADAMGRCLLDHASQKDRTDLMRWMFANAALHPDVAGLATVTPELRQEIDRTAGQLIQRLVFDSCRSQAGAALRSEGPTAMQQAFQQLAQLIGDSLVANPAVTQGSANVLRYMDVTRLPMLLMP